MTDAPAKLNPEKVESELLLNLSEENNRWNKMAIESKKVEVAKERLRKVYNTRWGTGVDLLLKDHDDLIAQLAEARAALQNWHDCFCKEHLEEAVLHAGTGDCLLCVTEASLHVVTGELEAMNANHRVMAGELAEMGRERNEARFALASLWGAAQTFCSGYERGRQEEDESALADLRTAIRGTQQVAQDDETLKQFDFACDAYVCSQLCAAYAKGQEKMRELAEKLYLDVTGNSDEPPDDRFIEKLRALPVTGLADGKENQ